MNCEINNLKPCIDENGNRHQSDNVNSLLEVRNNCKNKLMDTCWNGIIYYYDKDDYIDIPIYVQSPDKIEDSNFYESGDKWIILKGKKGEIGSIGQKGSIGEKGIRGSIGQKGQIGLTGQKGQIGLTGQKGQKGLTGQIGHIGLTGQKGQIGLTGQKGQTGSKGKIGDTGIKGSKGNKGEKGENSEVYSTDNCFLFRNNPNKEFDINDNNSNKCINKLWKLAGCKGSINKSYYNNNYNNTIKKIIDNNCDDKGKYTKEENVWIRNYYNLI